MMLNPLEIRPWIGGRIEYPYALVEQVRTRGWEEILPISVFEIPETIGAVEKYILGGSGHHRHLTGLVLRMDVPAIVYTTDDDLAEIGRLTGGPSEMPALNPLQIRVTLKKGYEIVPYQIYFNTDARLHS